MNGIVKGESGDDEDQTEDYQIANEACGLARSGPDKDFRHRIHVYGTHALLLQVRGLYVSAGVLFSEPLETKNPGRALRQHRPGVSDWIVHQADT
jgi:hypothetical protein